LASDNMKHGDSVGGTEIIHKEVTS